MSTSRDGESLFGMHLCFVEMLDRPLLQALRKTVVLFPRDIAMRLRDEFNGPMNPSRPIEAGINHGVVIQILAVVDGSLLDGADGFVDFMDRVFFLPLEFAVVRAFEMCSGSPQIGQCTQIRGVSLCKRIETCESENSRQG
jgi:hypothetical protein